MPLNETYQQQTILETPYLYIEKEGPFMTNAPLAWQELWKYIPQLSQYGIQSMFSRFILYPSSLYRACIALDTIPDSLPKELSIDSMPTGDYLVFTLTGSYEQLPTACGRVDEIVEESSFSPRKTWHMERYIGDPHTTPTDKLITEICIPI